MRVEESNYHSGYYGVKEKPGIIILPIDKFDRVYAKLAADCASVLMLRATISLHDESDVEAFGFFLEHSEK